MISVELLRPPLSAGHTDNTAPCALLTEHKPGQPDSLTVLDEWPRASSAALFGNDERVARESRGRSEGHTWRASPPRRDIPQAKREPGLGGLPQGPAVRTGQRASPQKRLAALREDESVVSQPSAGQVAACGYRCRRHSREREAMRREPRRRSNGTAVRHVGLSGAATEICVSSDCISACRSLTRRVDSSRRHERHKPCS